jgi:hypothetical protein
MSGRRSPVVDIQWDERGNEVRFTARDVARCKFIDAITTRRLRTACQRAMARPAKVAANLADPLRQRQVRKKDRPQCGSRVDGPNRPCRAPVLGYRDETGTPKLRALCFKHWNAEQALEALQRAEREAEKARRGCSCPMSGDLHIYGCLKWQPSPPDPNCAACRACVCNVHGPRGW